jgi:glycerol kinase
MVIWGFEIGDSEALLQAVRYLKFRPFCIKIILTGLQKSEITDCDTGGCGMWDIYVGWAMPTVESFG